MANVYVINKSSHDFSNATAFGNLIFMTEGSMNRFDTNNMIRQFKECLKGSKRTDYLLLCSLNVMNAVACAVFAKKHGTLNLLLYRNGKYVERNHLL